MAKPKINANQVKSVAAKAGAPTTPPVRVMSPDQIKKQAQARAKARIKMLVRVLIFMLSVAIIGFVVYLVKFYGRQPGDALEKAIKYAYENQTIKFKQQFTTDTILLVDGGDDTNEQPWKDLMDEITPMGEKPKILPNPVIEEKNNRKYAQVTIRLQDEKRVVHMREEDGKWKINFNVPINPKHLTLPEEIPPSFIDNFTIEDEDAAWWETPPDAQKKDGFLSKFKCSGGKKLF